MKVRKKLEDDAYLIVLYLFYLYIDSSTFIICSSLSNCASIEYIGPKIFVIG